MKIIRGHEECTFGRVDVVKLSIGGETKTICFTTVKEADAFKNGAKMAMRILHDATTLEGQCDD